MTSEPSVFAVALAQFDAMKAPTVIIPVVSDGDEGVFYATYQGDARVDDTRIREAAPGGIGDRLLQARLRRRRECAGAETQR